MTVKELADVCRVHYNTMRKWLADNKIEKLVYDCLDSLDIEVEGKKE